MMAPRFHRVSPCLLLLLLLGAASVCRAADDPGSGGGPPEIVYPTFKIGGFHDLTYAVGSRNAPRGFALGQYILHTNSLLGPSIQFFSEVSFSPRSDAGTGSPSAPGFNVEIERAILRFDYSDQLRLSTGRYHTPVNWWNTAYHHGQWLQTTVSRPEMVKFGGQFIPVHFVGGLLEGSTPLRNFNVAYKAGIGNGRGTSVGRGGDTGDSNGAAAWLFNLSGRPERLYGLEVGGSLYHDTITLADGRRYRESLYAAHVALETETPEVIGEYAHVDHDPVGGMAAGTHSEAYYVQVAYRLPMFDRKVKPYLRFERIKVPAEDVVFSATPSIRGKLAGVRYDVSDFVALKLEYRDFRRPTATNTTGLVSQLSFVF